MAWICIRKATKDDEERLLERQQAFLDRHPYMVSKWCGVEEPPEEHVLLWVDNYKQLYGILPDEWKAYRKVVQRALGYKDATGIAWGYIGHPE